MKNHQTSEQHEKSVLEELGIQVGPKLPLEVFSQAFSKLQSGLSARKIDRGGTVDRLKNLRFWFDGGQSIKGEGCNNEVATMVL
ncbi:MAG: hypothetical protein ACKPKO_06980, partial [Candidatus Fonsibacter sp.]